MAQAVTSTTEPAPKRRFFSSKNRIRSFLATVFLRIRRGFRAVFRFVTRYALLSFLLLLALLFGLIVLSNQINKPKVGDTKTAAAPKSVRVFHIGSSPRISVQGQVDKSGITQVVALTPGVIQNVYVKEGKTVAKGATLAYIASNYQGGNAAGIQAQLAQKQYDNVKATYDAQKDSIAKQREIANKSNESAADLRDITDQSLNDTRGIISLNEGILNTLIDTISNLEKSTPTTPAEQQARDAALLQARQGRTQVEAGLAQTRAGLRQAEYQSSDDKAPAQISTITKDLTLKQLEIQEKAIDLSRDVSKLQVQLAQVAAATMYPAAPFAGTVERVFVKPGQAVNPGTPIAVISATNNQHAKVIAYVSKDIAERLSLHDRSLVHVDGHTIEATPLYISQEAVSGTLYAIYYSIPDDYQGYLTDTAYIQIEVPIGLPTQNPTDPYIPIDALYQTANDAYVYVLENGTVVSRKVTIGDIFGRYIEVISGLQNSDVLILDRNVIEGDSAVAID